MNSSATLAHLRVVADGAQYKLERMISVNQNITRPKAFYRAWKRWHRITAAIAYLQMRVRLRDSMQR